MSSSFSSEDIKLAQQTLLLCFHKVLSQRGLHPFYAFPACLAIFSSKSSSICSLEEAWSSPDAERLQYYSRIHHRRTTGSTLIDRSKACYGATPKRLNVPLWHVTVAVRCNRPRPQLLRVASTATVAAGDSAWGARRRREVV